MKTLFLTSITALFLVIPANAATVVPTQKLKQP
jgi:hypothetical protein